MNTKWVKFLHDESGPTAVEYAIMLALIAAVCFAAIAAVGIENGGFWGNNADAVGKTLSESRSDF